MGSKLRATLFGAALLLAGPVFAQTLPWPDAAPAPQLQEAFAKLVMPPIVVSVPGMDKVVYRRDLAYTETNDPTIRMDVYQPAGMRADARKGAVIFIHGGAGPPSRPKDWGIYQSWGRLAAASGMVAVTFSHNLDFPETKVPAGAADVAAAIRYVEANAATLGIDPTRICLAAFSAGGPLLSTYMVDARPGIRCLVGYYPLMDIRQSSVHQQAETEETRQRFSPILKLDQPGRKTPLLLVRAGKDEIPTLLDGLDRFAAAALKADYPMTLANHPGGPHGFDNQVNDARAREIIHQTIDFLRYHLGEE